MAHKLICVKCGKSTYGTENIKQEGWICTDCKINEMETMTLEDYKRWSDELKRRNAVDIPIYPGK